MLFWLILIAAVAVDQVTKFWVVTHLALGQSQPFLGDFLRLTYTLNRGASFSMLQGQRWLFVGLTLAVIIVVIVIHFRYAKEERLFDAMLGLFSGGSLGNFIDRLTMGAVVDFFDLGWFPIFNVADSCIVVSVIILCLMILFGKTGKRLEERHG